MLSFGRILLGMLATVAILATPSFAAEDLRDAAAAREMLQVVLETEKSGKEVPWSSSTTGNKGTIRIERTFFRTPNLPCRDYIRTIEQKSGAKLTMRGTGCRVASENWSLEETLAKTEPPKEPEVKAVEKPKSVVPAEKITAVTPTPKTSTKKVAAAPPAKKAPPLLEYSLPTASDL
jgi:surface antigen